MRKEQLLKKAKNIITDRRYRAEEKSNAQLEFMRKQYPLFSEVERNYRSAQVK